MDNWPIGRVVILGNGYVAQAYQNEESWGHINRPHDFDRVSSADWNDLAWECIGSDKFRYNGSNFSELAILLEPFDVIINCIAKADTVAIEKPENFRVAWMVNVDLVRELSDYCAKEGKQFVHISTTDLYGNSHDEDGNNEDRRDLDLSNNYRLTKYAGERMCRPYDLVLRIRLPFDDNLHPRNILIKIPKFKKFFFLVTDMTYLPDLVGATKKLLHKGAKGTFNVVSDTSTSILRIARTLMELPHAVGLDPHFPNPNIITEFSDKNVTNICNSTKLRKYFISSDLEASIIDSYTNLLKKGLTVV